MTQTIRRKVERFQQLLVSAGEFSQPMNYFLDEIAPDEAFIAGCKQLNNRVIIAILVAAVEAIHQQSAGCKDDKAEPGILEVNQRFKLVHGVCRIGGRTGIVAFLRERDMGVVALPSAQDPDLVFFARFTGQGIEVPGGKSAAFDRSGYLH